MFHKPHNHILAPMNMSLRSHVSASLFVPRIIVGSSLLEITLSLGEPDSLKEFLSQQYFLSFSHHHFFPFHFVTCSSFQTCLENSFYPISPSSYCSIFYFAYTD